LRRLGDAVAKRLGKEFEVQEINVTYVDPLRPKNGQKYVAMSMKHLKFSYQTEFRVCLIPRKHVPDLVDPIFLELGSLEDISELIPFNPPQDAQKDKLFDL